MQPPPDDARPVRSFVAIEVDEPARRAILDYQDELRRRLDGVAWTAPENVHVTLKFLGAVQPARLIALAERLAAIAAAQPPFTIAYERVGAFPDRARPQVLWVGAVAPELASLATAVDEAAALAADVERERRPYHAHVTLGRVREQRARGARDRRRARAAGPIREVLAADAGRAFALARAAAVVLFRSDTGPAGARHTPLARLALGAVCDTR